MKKRICKSALLFLSLTFLCACGKTTAPEPEEENVLVEIAQNDWSGGFSRLAKIQSDVINIVSVLDTHNYNIIMGNPRDYWDEDDYYYLHFIPMDSDMMLSTMYINEVEDSTIVEQNVIANLSTLGFSNPVFQRLNKHEYLIQYDGTFTDRQTYTSYPGYRSISCIYDASHDWLQAVSSIENVSTLDIQEDTFYEFAEIEGGKYAFQNESERMYVEYDEEGQLKMFVYSELSDPPLQDDLDDNYEESNQDGQTLEEFILDITQQENPDENNEAVSESPGQEASEDDIATDAPESYGYFYSSKENSIFTHLDNIDVDWVNAAPNIKTSISFQDNILSVSIQNKLTGQTESFSVTKQEENADESLQEISEQEK